MFRVYSKQIKQEISVLSERSFIFSPNTKSRCLLCYFTGALPNDSIYRIHVKIPSKLFFFPQMRGNPIPSLSFLSPLHTSLTLALTQF